MGGLTIRHDHADGTLLEGDPRPHHGQLKDHGWRWARRGKFWYVPQSRDHEANEVKIEATKKALEACGFEVGVEIDNEWRSFEDRIESRVERAGYAEERREARAKRLETEAEAEGAKAQQVLDMIPMGQPVLVGHHSERRHRRDLDRAHNAIGKSVNARKEAERLARVGSSAPKLNDPVYLGNRIRETEAELRRMQRYGRESAVQRLEGDLAGWKQLLADCEANGAKLFRPEDLKPGDVIKRRRGGLATVTRVNKKTVTCEFEFLPGIPQRLPYEEVREVIGNVAD